MPIPVSYTRQMEAKPVMEKSPMPRRKGRAAAFNTPNRFDPVTLELDPAELTAEELRQVPTIFFDDKSRTILSKNNSPDIPFTYSINPYRGCEHGCIYCYARPSHEYLGWSAGLDFETRILVKRDAPELLSRAFQKTSWQPQVICLSGNTDPYQPAERQLKLSRGCLKVFLRHRNPVSIITKNHLVTRDLDLLGALARRNLVSVSVSVTSLRPELASTMEPRTSTPRRRLDAVQTLADAGVPVGVMVAPIVPGLTDEEVPAILKAAAQHRARWAGYVILRLPGPVAPLFVDWLSATWPDRKDKVLRRIQELRGGKLTDSAFGRRMRGQGIWAETLTSLFKTTCRSLNLNQPRLPLSTDQFRRLADNQRSLFDE